MRKSVLVSVIASMTLIAGAVPASAAVPGSASASPSVSASSIPAGFIVKCRPELEVSVESPLVVKVLAKPGPNWWGTDEGELAAPEPLATEPDPADVVPTPAATATPTPTPSPDSTTDPASTPSPSPTTVGPAPAEPAAVAAARAGGPVKVPGLAPSQRWRCPHGSIKISVRNESTGWRDEWTADGPWERSISLKPGETLRVKVTQTPDSVEKYVTTPDGVPGPPRDVIATGATPTSLTLSWVKPAYDGDLPITGYEVWRGKDKYADVTSTSVMVTDLMPDTLYTMVVYAKNAYARSPGVEVSGRTAPQPTVPEPPDKLSRTGATQSTVSLAWIKPRDGGSPIVGYKVYVDGTYRDYTTTEAATVNGLSAETLYTFGVEAVNAYGDSTRASIKVKTGVVLVPGPPRDLQVTSTGTDRIALKWKAPDKDGGSPVTGYVVTVAGGEPVATSQTSVVLTGLESATKYTISVVAKNKRGPSSAATVDARTIIKPIPRPNVPTAPRDLAAPGVTATTVTLDWEPPSSTGGAQIEGYTVTWGPGTRKSVDATASSAEITGLTAATRYDFSVTAENSMGSSPAAGITVWTHNPPAPEPTPPSPVRAVVAIAASQTALDVGWLPPADDGGSPVTFYVVSWAEGKAAIVTETSMTVTGLEPSTEYTITVQARNAKGLSPAVTTTGRTLYPPVPEPTPPTAPRSLISTATTTTSVGLAWLRPDSDGGAPISGYTVSWGASQSTTVSTTTAEVTGLAPSTDYTFTVRANNAMGASPPVSLTVQTPARPTPPGPSPKPADITPAATGTNVDASLDLDDDNNTLRQTVDAKWPASLTLVSGRPVSVQKKTGLITNAAQEVAFVITYMSPSVKSVVVQKRPAKGLYLLTATLKKGKKSGSVVVTATAPATIYKGRSYQALQSSQRFLVRPAAVKKTIRR